MALNPKRSPASFALICMLLALLVSSLFKIWWQPIVWADPYYWDIRFGTSKITAWKLFEMIPEALENPYATPEALWDQQKENRIQALYIALFGVVFGLVVHWLVWSREARRMKRTCGGLLV